MFSFFRRKPSAWSRLIANASQRQIELLALAVTGVGTLRMLLNEQVVSRVGIPLPVTALDEAVRAVAACVPPLSETGTKMTRIEGDEILRLIRALVNGGALQGAVVYSNSQREAWTQLIVRWRTLLGSSDPNFVSKLSASPLSQEFYSLAGGMLGGTARMLERGQISIGDIVKRAEKDVSKLSIHEVNALELAIREARQDTNQVLRFAYQRNTADSVNVEPKSVNVEPKFDVGFGEDGRANLLLGAQADIWDIQSAMAVVFRRDLPPKDMATAARLFGAHGGRWTNEADRDFARAFVSWLAQGGLEGPGDMKKWARPEHLAFPLTPEMRELFARMLGKRP